MTTRFVILRLLFALGAVAAWASAATSPACAQAPHGPRYATVSAVVRPAALPPGGRGTLVVSLVIAPGFHVNSFKPNDANLIATSFDPTPGPGMHFFTPAYPKPTRLNLAGESKPTPVYMGAVSIFVPFTLPKHAQRGHIPVTGVLTYQGCNASACFPPKQDHIQAMVTVK